MRLLRSRAMSPVSKLLPIAALLAGLTACGGGNDNFGPFVLSAGDTFALTSGNRLISFNRASPSTGRTRVAITGLATGERLVGIDFRPANGQLYGVAMGAGGAGALYTVNTATGVATPVAAPVIGAFTLSGTAFGVDFNPVPDALRIVSDTGQNLRIVMGTGAVNTDTPLTGPGEAGVTAVAYTNNFSNACRTAIYYLDTSEGMLLTASGNPNAGVTAPVGALGAGASTPSPATAFEIVSVSEASNTGFAAITGPTTTAGVFAPQLYTIDLATGAATSRGAIGGAAGAGEQVLGLAMAPPATLPPIAAGEIYGVTETNKLVSFNRGFPGKLCSSATIAPLSANEQVVGIDFRPSTGVLHGLGNANGVGRVLTIDPATAAVTGSVAVGGTSPVALVGTDFGMDFNPTGLVALRIVSNTGQNLRMGNLESGATVVDSGLTGAATGATAAAYTNSVQGGPTTTTLYVVDSAANPARLMVQGANPSVAGTGVCPASAGNPNCGVLTAVGSLGFTAQSVNGFDIDGRNNVALLAASADTATTSTLYTVDLATGTATAIAPAIGGGERLRGLTRPTPTTTVLGLTTANELVQLSLTDPTAVTSIGAVTGLGSENLLGIDFRPSTGVLYGVGSAGGLFTINPQTAAATLVAPLSASAADTADGNAPYAAPPAGSAFGVDFNPFAPPVPLRVVSNTAQNLRVGDVATGATFTDLDLNRAPVTFNISAVAYTNSFPTPTSTVLYGLDATGDRLVAITPPNNGTVRVIGATGADVTASSSMEIVGPATAVAVFDGALAKTLYTVNLATGAATAGAAIGTADAVLGLAAAPSTIEPAVGSLLFAATSGGNLISFARNAPATVTVLGALGVGAGETVRGIDFRSDGVLWLLTSDLGNVARLYTVSTTTGAATLVGMLNDGATPASAPRLLSGAAFGMDFNPLPAAVPLRIISDSGQNLRVTSLTTLATAVDTSLGQPAPTAFAAAYTNSFPSPSGTTLYVLDAATGSLMTQAPPNNGVLNIVGALSGGIGYTLASGFDIAGGANGLVLAALQQVIPQVPPAAAITEAQSRLFRINLLTGAATEVAPGGLVGGATGVPLRGLAIRVQ